MSYSRFKNLKNIFYSGFLCAGVNYNVDSTQVTQYNLDHHIRQAAEQYLATQGVNAYNIPDRLQSDFQLKLEQARLSALEQLNKHGKSHLNSNDLQTIIRRAMEPFANNLRSVVQSYNLEQAIKNGIDVYLRSNGLTQDSINDRDVAEFINRSSRITSTLQTIMSRDGRDYVRMQEIEKTIKDELGVFVQRIKHSQSSYTPAPAVVSNYNTQPTPYWPSTPTPSYSSSQPSVTTTSAAKVMLYELEQSVMNAANSTLRTYNIDPNNVPARVVAEFSSKIQTIIRRLKDTINNSGRNYVWKDEMEQVVLQEMQGLIDRITFKGQACVICQEVYTKGQRVGLTSCGHHYHKDCIYKWFTYQKTCPQCQASNIIVEKIETAG